MKKLIVFLLLISTIATTAQTYQQNLEKYWYFRHRLKDQFMLYSSNPYLLGSNTPAETMADTLITNSTGGTDYDYQNMRWGDGIWWLGHYMAVLALEYRLLKDNNQDYSNTLTELNNAIIAYDRLDSIIETCFPSGSSDLNGFFARDDVPASNSQFFPSSFHRTGFIPVLSDYIDHCDISDKNVSSQDQIISLFLGLKLVNKLVAEPGVYNKTREIASSIIDRMHYPYDLFGIGIEYEIWEILNPVTGSVVPDGGSFSSLYPQIWAIVEAAENITGQNEHETYSDNILTKETWDNVQNTILMHFEEDGDPLSIPIIIGIPSLGIPPIYITTIYFYGFPFNAYMISVLSTLIDDPGGGFSSTYEWLVNFEENTEGFLGMPVNTGLYPHLPLIYRIIHGYEGSNLVAASDYETKFLNSAPGCGAHHYVCEDNDVVTAPPWHTVSLGSPQHNKGN
jgi:hypothetical protein